MLLRWPLHAAVAAQKGDIKAPDQAGGSRPLVQELSETATDGLMRSPPRALLYGACWRGAVVDVARAILGNALYVGSP